MKNQNIAKLIMATGIIVSVGTVDIFAEPPPATQPPARPAPVVPTGPQLTPPNTPVPNGPRLSPPASPGQGQPTDPNITPPTYSNGYRARNAYLHSTNQEPFQPGKNPNVFPSNNLNTFSSNSPNVFPTNNPNIFGRGGIKGGTNANGSLAKPNSRGSGTNGFYRDMKTNNIRPLQGSPNPSTQGS